MNKFIKWIKSHMRPYIRIKGREQYDSALKDTDQPEDFKNKVEDMGKNVEVGFKINFKF